MELGVTDPANKRPPWAVRWSALDYLSMLIASFALLDVLGWLFLNDLLARVSPALKVVSALAILVALFFGVPLVMTWRLGRNQRMERTESLPPVVPMAASSRWRRIYRRFGWVPTAPIVAYDLAVGNYVIRPFDDQIGPPAVLFAIMILGPLAFYYWLGDRHR